AHFILHLLDWSTSNPTNEAQRRSIRHFVALVGRINRDGPHGGRTPPGIARPALIMLRRSVAGLRLG
ncbi:hypothetical protein, partial [Sphingopyxis sp.]|uniref:hypothetical protein n=1 Tax=Sphingopyxis sp. TaxID=1908224 RepID=UPI002ED94488